MIIYTNKPLNSMRPSLAVFKIQNSLDAAIIEVPEILLSIFEPYQIIYYIMHECKTKLEDVTFDTAETIIFPPEQSEGYIRGQHKEVQTFINLLISSYYIIKSNNL